MLYKVLILCVALTGKVLRRIYDSYLNNFGAAIWVIKKKMMHVFNGGGGERLIMLRCRKGANNQSKGIVYIRKAFITG